MDKAYDELLNKYLNMFSKIDAFHFNSENTSKVYGQFLDITQTSHIIPITHNGIIDKRCKRYFDKTFLRLGYIGSEATYKGLPVLRTVVERLNANGFGNMFSLSIYGGRKGVDRSLKNIKFMGRYSSGMLNKVFDTMDLLIVPSICYETFSLITLEALSFGVPVLVSNTVGAKDIVSQYSQEFVYDGERELYDILLKILQHRNILAQFNDRILTLPWHHTMNSHSKDIIDKLYKK